MRDARLRLVLFAMVVGLSSMTPDRAEAQAVGFAPTVGVVPDGVSLNVTPVVTADRRYVRLSLNPNFSTINGFSNFPVPAAVGGGGSGGGVRGGLGGLGGGGGGGGAGGGGVGGGFRNVMGGAGLVGSGVPYNVEFLEASRKADAQARLRKAKSAVGKKPLPDAFIVPIKKAKADAPRG